MQSVIYQNWEGEIKLKKVKQTIEENQNLFIYFSFIFFRFLSD